jgi:opacity protein-like surface antigen
MKKCLVLLAMIMFIAPTFIFSNLITFKIGYFLPRAQGGKDSLWTIEFDNMSFTKSNFSDTVYGFAYEYFVTPQLSLVLSVDGYSKTKVGYYRDYIGFSFKEGDFAFPEKIYGNSQDAFSIEHSFAVSITPFQLSLKLTPLGRRTRLIPYVGGGIGAYLWNVRLRGDTIDFNDAWIYTDADPAIGDVEVYKIKQSDLDERREKVRFSFGYHAFAGLMFPVGNRLTIDGQFKYNSLKVTLEAFKDFEDFDLSGYQLTIGLNYWF